MPEHCSALELGDPMHWKQSKLDVVFLVVNTLSSAGTQSPSDTYRLKNNQFGDALSSSTGHFAPIQAEVSSNST